MHGFISFLLTPVHLLRSLSTVFKRSNPLISLIILTLTSLGLLAVFTTGRHLNSNPYHYFYRQLAFSVIGLFVLLSLAIVDYTKFLFEKKSPYFITSGFLLAVIFFGNGRWLNLKLINIQPSELGKLVIIMYISYVMAFVRFEELSFINQSLPIMIVTFSLVGFTLMQPDFGTALIMMVIALYMFILTKFPIKHLLIPVIPFIPLAFIVPFRYPYVMSRYLNFVKNIDPRTPVSFLSFHDYGLRMSMGNGGLTGLGFGNGIVKRSFLPASHTDSIFAVLVEEGGFLMGVTVIFLFVALLLLGESTARDAKDRFGAYLARGITFYLSGQAFLNICICLGLLPNTGITIPFVSYGGSSLIVSMAAVGILINISSQRRMII
jgi:cell division protein FtsW